AAVPVEAAGPVDVAAGDDGLGLATGVHAPAMKATASSPAHRRRGFARDAIAVSSAPSSRS
ncbi:MAG TPA: hypothetical protein VGC90_07570, partial [Candidatus Limnocylindrales bacterium]